jgi:hypothetical protein
MASTFSPSLRLELIETGAQAGTWGTTTNNTLGTLMESAVSGYTSVSITSANQALTALNGAPDQSRNLSIALTTNTGAAFNVYAPPAPKTYIIYNTSAFAATIFNSTVLGNTTAAGTGVTIPAGRTMAVWSDGTNFRVVMDHLISPTIASPAMSGTPTAPTAAPGTNNTQVATTAFTAAAVTAATGSLGTMSTQNANNVNITGGSVTGITDITIADGGTGASTAAQARTNLGLVIGTDVLAPNGNGSALTNLNANNLASGTVPVTRSGALRLISRQNVFNSTTTGTVTVSLPTSLFEGNTPSFVMFSANARATDITDLRQFYMVSGSSFNQDNLVLGGSSDDTDQAGTGTFNYASTFVLPYNSSQQFTILRSWGAGSYGGTRIYVIGYQV